MVLDVPILKHFRVGAWVHSHILSIFTKGDNFCEFLFVSLEIETLP